MKTLTLIRTALLGTIEALIPVEVALSWGLASASREGPRLIVQPVSSGQPKRYIGLPLGWMGEIAVRAQADTMDAAQTLFTEVAAGVPASLTLDDPDYAPGWSLRLLPDRPIPGLTGPTTATVGAIYRAMLLPRSA